MAAQENSCIEAKILHVSNPDLDHTDITLKVKVKINLISQSSASSIKQGNHSDNNTPYIFSKYSGTHTLCQSELTADDGGVNSPSWARISRLISDIAMKNSFRLKKGLLLEGHDELVAQVLKEARLAAATGKDSNIELCIDKEVFVGYDVFITRLHEFDRLIRIQEVLERCVSKLQPPVDEKTVRREIVARLRDGGAVNDVPDQVLDLLIDKVLSSEFKQDVVRN